jgi:hypothetical protein
MPLAVTATAAAATFRLNARNINNSTEDIYKKKLPFFPLFLCMYFSSEGIFTLLKLGGEGGLESSIF